MNIRRVVRHLFTPHWIVQRAFPWPVLKAIEQAIAASEKKHDGELRFAVEAALHPGPLWRGETTRARAVEFAGVGHAPTLMSADQIDVVAGFLYEP